MELKSLEELRVMCSSEIDNIQVAAIKELEDMIKAQTIVELEVSAFQMEIAKLNLKRKELEPILIKAKSNTSILRAYITRLKSLFYSARNTEN